MIDLVIVNYRTPADLRECLQSLNEVWLPPGSSVTVMNVDARPIDVAVAEEFRPTQEQYRHYEYDVNVGYATAVNDGAFWGNSDFLGIFNADVVFRPGVIPECVQALRENPEWGVLGPRQVDARNRLTHSGLYDSGGRLVDRGWRKPDMAAFADIREVPSVSGSAYFVRRSAWESLTSCPLYQQVAPGAKGAFLPTQHYYEDEWCSRHAVAHGWKVIYYGPVVMVHKWHRASTVGGPAEMALPVSRKYFREACQVHGISPSSDPMGASIL